MTQTKWGKAPSCSIGKNHRWNQSDSGVCGKCGYDVLEKRYLGGDYPRPAFKKTEVLEAEALRAPPIPKGTGIRAGDLL